MIFGSHAYGSYNRKLCQWQTRRVSALTPGGKGGRRCKPRSRRSETSEVQMCLKEEVVISAEGNKHNCPLFHLPVLSGPP